VLRLRCRRARGIPDGVPTRPGSSTKNEIDDEKRCKRSREARQYRESDWILICRIGDEQSDTQRDHYGGDDREAVDEVSAKPQSGTAYAAERG
jgi:hypothetical protein